jgi:hypothetical protein
VSRVSLLQHGTAGGANLGTPQQGIISAKVGTPQHNIIGAKLGTPQQGIIGAKVGTLQQDIVIGANVGTQE